MSNYLKEQLLSLLSKAFSSPEQFHTYYPLGCLVVDSRGPGVNQALMDLFSQSIHSLVV